MGDGGYLFKMEGGGDWMNILRINSLDDVPAPPPQVFLPAAPPDSFISAGYHSARIAS